jgi:hypothetical protein
VAPGTYKENVNFLGKAITVKGPERERAEPRAASEASYAPPFRSGERRWTGNIAKGGIPVEHNAIIVRCWTDISSYYFSLLRLCLR